MPMKFSTPTTTACLCFLVAFALYIGGARAPKHASQLEPQGSPPVTAPFTPERSSPSASVASTQPVSPIPAPVAVAPTPPPLDRAPFPGTPPKIAFTSGPLGWELQLKEARSKATDGTSAAVAILRMLSYLPEEALETAVEQALQNLPDKSWAATAGPFLVNPASHVRVLSVLFADLMERPQPVSLPLLARIAKDPSHPFTSFAFDNLRLFLGEDLKLADLTSGLPIEQKENAVPPAPSPEVRQ